MVPDLWLGLGDREVAATIVSLPVMSANPCVPGDWLVWGLPFFDVVATH